MYVSKLELEFLLGQYYSSWFNLCKYVNWNMIFFPAYLDIFDSICVSM
jgi:hypothetical protein